MIIRSFSEEFFSSLIEKLNDRSVRYCVIGDYCGLPESVGHDVDMWTDDVSAFRLALFESVKECGYKVLIDNRTNNGCNVAFFQRDGDSITIMKIDVLVDTSYKSYLTLVDKSLMANNIVAFKNFFVANPEIEATMHFLYPMFEWCKIKKDSYKQDILKYCESPTFVAALERLWNKKTSRKIIGLIKTEDWNEIQCEMKGLRRHAIMKSLFTPSFIKNVFFTACNVLRRVVKPSGFCLAFCGLDGAGKTTILDELNDIFVDLLKSKKVYYGYWRPFVVPEIRELFGKKNSKSDVDKAGMKGRSVNEPEKKPKNTLVSFLKLMYYFLDYRLAPLKYGKIRNRGGMVLFDRHYIDMAVHPQRFEMKISRSIILLLYKLIPKADYTFFLWCTPDEIYERKQEFGKDEIQQQIDSYLMVGKKIKNFIPIHTNTTIAEEIDEILSCIAKK